MTRKTSSVAACIVEGASRGEGATAGATIPSPTGSRGPFRVRLLKCPYDSFMECQAAVVDSLSDSVSVILTAEEIQCIFVAGPPSLVPFKLFQGNAPLQYFSDFQSEKQHAFWFEVMGAKTEDQAHNIEKALMKLDCVNAAAVCCDPATACVFVDEDVKRGDFTDTLQISVTVDWTYFASLRGRTKYRGALDQAEQFIGIYLTMNNQLLLADLQKMLQHLSGIAKVTICSDPPCLKVTVSDTFQTEHICTKVKQVLDQAGFPSQIVPVRVILYQTDTCRSMQYHTSYDCDEIDYQTPKKMEPTTTLPELFKQLQAACTPMKVTLTHQKIYSTIVSFGGSKCMSCWREIGEELTRLDICACYVDLTASRLMVLSYSSTVAASIPATLKKVGVDAEVKETAFPGKVSEEMDKITKFHKTWGTRDWADSETSSANTSFASDSALFSQHTTTVYEFDSNNLCPTCALELEDILVAHSDQGIVASLVDSERHRVYVRHNQSLSPDQVQAVLTMYGFAANWKGDGEAVATEMEEIRSKRVESPAPTSPLKHGVNLLEIVSAKKLGKKPTETSSILGAQHYAESPVGSNNEDSPNTDSGRRDTQKHGSTYEPVLSLSLRAKRPSTKYDVNVGNPVPPNFDSKSASSERTAASEQEEEIVLSMFMESSVVPLRQQRQSSEDDTSRTTEEGQSSASRWDHTQRARTYGDYERQRREPKAQSSHRSRSLTPPPAALHQHTEFHLVLQGTNQQTASKKEPEPLSADQYLFHHPWNFWFDVRTGNTNMTAEDFEKNLQDLGCFDSVGGFWRYWKPLDVANLRDNCNLRLFKKGVKPVVEDPVNVNGRRWVVHNLDKAHRVKIWTNVVMAMIGELIPDNTKDTVVGIVMSTKPSGDVIQVWTDGGYYNDRDEKFDISTVRNNEPLPDYLQRMLFPEATKQMFVLQTHHRTAIGMPNTSHSTQNATQSGGKNTAPHGAGGAGGRMRGMGGPGGRGGGGRFNAQQSWGGSSQRYSSEPKGAAEVRQFLINAGLTDYFDTFIHEGFDEMRTVVTMTSADLDLVKMIKPGHQSRFYSEREKYIRNLYPAMYPPEAWFVPPETPLHQMHGGGANRGYGGAPHMGGAQKGAFNWRSDQDKAHESVTHLLASHFSPTDVPPAGGKPGEFEARTPPGPLSALLSGKSPTTALPTTSTLSPSSRVVGRGRPPPQSQAGGVFQALNPYAPAFLTASIPFGVGGGTPAELQKDLKDEINKATNQSDKEKEDNKTNTGGEEESTHATAITTTTTTGEGEDDQPVEGELENAQDEEEGKKRLTWRDLKSGKDWRSYDWDAMPEDERKELWERMEERTAIELSDESQELLKETFPIPNSEWQTLGKYIYVRTGLQDDTPLPGGVKVDDTIPLVLDGIGQNPRLVALKFGGVKTEYGGPAAVPHCVLYKSQCTRQEESQHITDWKAPPTQLVLQGTVKKIWRLKQQKRNNPSKNKKKKGPGGGQYDHVLGGGGMGPTWLNPSNLDNAVTAAYLHHPAAMHIPMNGPYNAYYNAAAAGRHGNMRGNPGVGYNY